MLQDEVFSRSEGDSWFGRNRDALQACDPDVDLPLRLLQLYGLRPLSVLEVGAANGARLAAIHRMTGARTLAVEPSAQAIQDGHANFPFVTFVRGTVDAVPLHESYDLVIVNFVFHWVDRLTLFRSVAEVDRLVCDGGFLIVGDFQPANRLRVPYHHLQDGGIYTYKQDYAEQFRSSGLYHPVGMLTAHHATKQLDPNVAENERIGAWLLRKDLRSHYFVSGVNGNGA
jgi:trans-aconitate methyltransferase